MSDMGEAKAKKQTPWPRKMHVEAFEAYALLGYFTSPASGPNGPYLRSTRTRDERKSLKAALSLIGLYEGWQAASRAGGKSKVTFPSVKLVPFSEESVNFLLGALTDMDNSSGLTLIEFEERLEILKAGNYEVPEDIAEQLAEIETKQIEGAPVDGTRQLDALPPADATTAPS